MAQKNKGEEKTSLHPRNKNRERYDLNALVKSTPDLGKYIKSDKVGRESVDFANPKAVRLLNKALLRHYYGIDFWEFPEKNLVPPIPGRAEYIHLVADLLAEANGGKIPEGEDITCLDVGAGASCVYPIIGVTEYGWRFIASDIDPESIQYAEKIVESNPSLKGKVICKVQQNPNFIFRGIIRRTSRIDVSICNPPFHSSLEDLQKGNVRKVKNLTGKKTVGPALNFSGNSNELIYEGGEFQFIKNMIIESREFSKTVFWFTSLVSKEQNLKKVYQELKKARPAEIKTLEIKTGNKLSRVVAWTYLSVKERKAWRGIG